MGRGIVEAKTGRTEQYQFEARTTDPANAQPGEYWVRSDQTSSNPDVVAELRRQDNSGVTKIPLFAASEESSLGNNVVRGPSVVLDGGSVGFVAMTTDSGAKIGSPRAVTAAGDEYLSHNSLRVNGLPDTSMLDGVIYHWWAGAGIGVSDGQKATNWDDQQSGITASAVDSPTYQSDISGFEAVDSDGSDDGYNWSGDSNLPTGFTDELTVLGLVYPDSTSGDNALCGWGTGSGGFSFIVQSGSVRIIFYNNNDISGGLVSRSQWQTIGATRTSAEKWRIFKGGNGIYNTTVSEPLSADNEAIAYDAIAGGRYNDGNIAEVIVCDSHNSQTQISDYHNDRLP